MRSLYLARGAQERWPEADIRFIVSREAPYAGEVPFRTYLTDNSPTKHVREVNRIVSEVQPDVVLFDCSGRVAQMKHAHHTGCRTVFVSQHIRKRRRGFKISRMRYCDLHWIVQPPFVDGDLNRIERFKLKFLGRPLVSFIGPVFPPEKKPEFALPGPQYFFACAGGGGNSVHGRNSAEIFAEAASKVTGETGIPGVMVMGPNYTGSMDAMPGLRIVPRLSGAEVVYVLGHAAFAILGGGDMLGQAAALRIPAVTAAVAGDQPPRIAAYHKAGLCIEADPERLAETVLAAMDDNGMQDLRARLAKEGLHNGLNRALDQVGFLLSAGDRSI